MSYHIEKKEEIRIVGIRTPLAEEAEENMENIPAFWKRVKQENQVLEIAKYSNDNPKGILGVSVYNNPQDIYYYIAVPSDAPVPEGFAEYTIPAAMWVVFENDGLFKDDVQNVFRRFLTEFLPFSGYEYAEQPDVELYPSFEGQAPKGHSEVWIAIKRERRNYNVPFTIER